MKLTKTYDEYRGMTLSARCSLFSMQIVRKPLANGLCSLQIMLYYSKTDCILVFITVIVILIHTSKYLKYMLFSLTKLFNWLSV